VVMLFGRLLVIFSEVAHLNPNGTFFVPQIAFVIATNKERKMNIFLRTASWRNVNCPARTWIASLRSQ
jgi:hypothetical protein